MRTAAAVAAIEARFLAAWSDTPVHRAGGRDGAGAPFQPPRDGAGMPAPFLALRVDWTGGESVSVDGARRRRYGLIWLIAFVRAGADPAEARDLIDRAAAVFDLADFAGVSCETAAPGGEAEAAAVGKVAGSYYGEAASIPFTVDEDS